MTDFETEDDFGTEGDLRRTALLERALGEFFGPRRPTFQRAFQGSSVASALLTSEMFAFHTSLLCIVIEKKVLPLLDVNEPTLAGGLRAQLQNVIDCGNMRPTHPEARDLLRTAMVAGLRDLEAEFRATPESNDATPSSSHGTGNAHDVDRRSAPEQLRRDVKGAS